MHRKKRITNMRLPEKLKDSRDVAAWNEERRNERVRLVKIAKELYKNYLEITDVESKERLIILGALKQIHYQKWLKPEDLKTTSEKFEKLMEAIKEVPLVMTRETQQRI